MTHWGWYWKVKRNYTPKILCSELLSIDSFTLFKNKKMTGFRVPNQCEAVLEEDYFKVIRTQKPDSYYKIPVEKQPCNYGGYRYFFHCPSCDKRMRKLYYYQGYFLCRKCLRLGYLSQRLLPEIRYASQQNKIKKRLNKQGGNTHKKPKWMKHKKFETLCNRYFEYENKCYEAIYSELHYLEKLKIIELYLQV